jgi:hypothetical protein
MQQGTVLYGDWNGRACARSSCMCGMRVLSTQSVLLFQDASSYSGAEMLAVAAVTSVERGPVFMCSCVLSFRHSCCRVQKSFESSVLRTKNRATAYSSQFTCMCKLQRGIE